jgi:hypothetical protein
VNDDRQAICLPRRLAGTQKSRKNAGTRLAQGRNSGIQIQMKTPILSGIAALLAALVTSGSAQNPASTNEQKLQTLIQEVQAQQAQITANQEKLDGKMAEVTEAVRVARIFAGRGGK